MRFIRTIHRKGRQTPQQQSCLQNNSPNLRREGAAKTTSSIFHRLQGCRRDTVPFHEAVDTVRVRDAQIFFAGSFRRTFRRAVRRAAARWAVALNARPRNNLYGKRVRVRVCTRAGERKRERSFFLRGIVLELELNITPLTARLCLLATS